VETLPNAKTEYKAKKWVKDMANDMAKDMADDMVKQKDNEIAQLAEMQKKLAMN
jgi:hypothetical protein